MSKPIPIKGKGRRSGTTSSYEDGSFEGDLSEGLASQPSSWSKPSVLQSYSKSPTSSYREEAAIISRELTIEKGDQKQKRKRKNSVKKKPAEKMDGEGGKKGGKKGNKHGPSRETLHDDVKRENERQKKSLLDLHRVGKQVELFSHLAQYEKRTSEGLKIGFSSSPVIHPAVIQLGIKYSCQRITGSNARAVALIEVLRILVQQYRLPPTSDISIHFITYLNPQINFLADARQLSASMRSTISSFKNRLKDTKGMSEEEGKALLLEHLENFEDERIHVSSEQIVLHGLSKIKDGDVILTFVCSSTVLSLLTKASQVGKRIRVIVVDSSPRFEGQQFLSRLQKRNIPCTYVLLSSLSYIMSEATKVIMGAHGVMSNGYVLARAGTSIIAMTAVNLHVPVIICCETYKFAKDAQIDSVCYNELGDPDELCQVLDRLASRGDYNAAKEMEALKEWRDSKAILSLKLLNLVYDVTPQEYITMVITEYGLIPPTSVKSVVREHGLDE